MKNLKNSVVIAKTSDPRPNWTAKFGQMLHPRRKRAWINPVKTNPLAAIHLGGWLKKP
jgi:hypothetical protein